jgi:tRNA-Thr(GGU) m(6)t(6)A37 methyltransferase TsaA
MFIRLSALFQACERGRVSKIAPVERLDSIGFSSEVGMAEAPYTIRKGEIAVDLPASFDASVYFIGRIHTPWKRRQECPKNGRESHEVCTIEVDKRWAQALRGVESCSHLVVLYWMDQARRDLVVQAPRHYDQERGSFALRSPVRPNPIAMSVVRLLGVEGRKLKVRGLDCLDRTPLLDLKPYFASTDSIPGAKVGWHKDRKRKQKSKKRMKR